MDPEGGDLETFSDFRKFQRIGKNALTGGGDHSTLETGRVSVGKVKGTKFRCRPLINQHTVSGYICFLQKKHVIFVGNPTSQEVGPLRQKSLNIIEKYT